jgi:hypothetical protein
MAVGLTSNSGRNILSRDAAPSTLRARRNQEGQLLIASCFRRVLGPEAHPANEGAGQKDAKTNTL